MENSSDNHAALSMKDVATTIANQMLIESWKRVTQTQTKEILAFARKWGAKISAEQEDQAVSDLREFFEQPTQWPNIQLTSPAAITTSTAAPAPRGRKPVDSDSEPKPSDGNKRKATDYGELKLPDNMAPILCPVEVKSGDRKGMKCGKVCKRVTDAHNPANPICAKFECNHLYCGQHVAKASGMDTSEARKRLEQASTAGSGPVSVKDGDKETTIPPGSLGELKPESQSAAAKQTVSAIFDRVKKRKEAAAKRDGVANNNNE